MYKRIEVPNKLVSSEERGINFVRLDNYFVHFSFLSSSDTKQNQKKT